MVKGALFREIEIVFDEHFHEFCLLAYTYVGCRDQAQDIVQDVFVKMLQKENILNTSNLKGYVWMSVKNTSLKQIRKSKKLEPLDSLESLMEEEITEDKELYKKLHHAMDKLPPKCRNVFELCVIDGYRYASAADFLGISINTVKTQMNKAYKILRNDLGTMLIILLILSILH